MSLSVTMRATNKVFTWTTLMAIIQQFYEVLPGFNLCIWRSKRRFVSKECGCFIVHYFHVNSDFYPLLLLPFVDPEKNQVLCVSCWLWQFSSMFPSHWGNAYYIPLRSKVLLFLCSTYHLQCILLWSNKHIASGMKLFSPSSELWNCGVWSNSTL